MKRPAQQQGMILVLALLCLLALEVSAVGVHYIASQEFRTAKSVSRDLELRLAAQGAVARVLQSWPAGLADSLAVLSSADITSAGGQTAHDIRYGARLERLGPHLFLVRATAVSPLRETATIGAVLSTAEPADMVATLSAALRTNGALSLQPGSRIVISGGCPAAYSPNALEMTGAASLIESSGQTGGPVISGAPPGDYPTDRVGALDLRSASRTATPIGPIGPTGPPAGGGDSSTLPVYFRQGGLSLNGAKTVGTLVIDGDVVLSGGTFEGILLVRGSLRVTGGARVTGMIIVEGGPTTIGDAIIARDACVLLRAVTNPQLLGPFRLRGRMWIPIF